MKTAKVRPQLYAYLGLEDGELALYCSTGRLNRIGSRLERGKPLCVPIGKAYDLSGNDVNQAVRDLNELQEYFDKEASGKR